MKSLIPTAALAALLGFALGWFLKPDPQTSPAAATVPSRPQAERPTLVPEASPEPFRPGRELAPLPSPAENPQTSFGQIPASSDKLNQAKWLRLMEILNLNSEQTAMLEAGINESLALLDSEETSEAFRQAGEELEKRIAAILNPEQKAAFDEMRERDRQNRLESRSQLALHQELEGLDLDPAQRSQAIEILRAQAEEDLSKIPESTRLVLDSSFLPLERQTLGEDGIILLEKLRNEGQSPDDFQNMLRQHQAELEQKKSLFESVLSPAQLAAYHARLEEYERNIRLLAPH